MNRRGMAVAGGLGLTAAVVWWEFRPLPPKPYDMLEAAKAAYDENRDDDAERLYRLALDRARAIRLDKLEMRGFVNALTQIYLVRDKLEEAETLAPAPLEEPLWRPDGTHVAYNKAVLLLRRGRPADAAPLLEGALADLKRTYIEGQETLRLLALEQLDRCYVALGRIEETEPLTRQYVMQITELGGFTGGHYPPLTPGLAPRVARYAAFLRTSGRGDAAANIEQLLANLETRAPSVPLEARCFSFNRPPPTGCLLDPE